MAVSIIDYQNRKREAESIRKCFTTMEYDVADGILLASQQGEKLTQEQKDGSKEATLVAITALRMFAHEDKVQYYYETLEMYGVPISPIMSIPDFREATDTEKENVKRYLDYVQQSLDAYVRGELPTEGIS